MIRENVVLLVLADGVQHVLGEVVDTGEVNDDFVTLESPVNLVPHPDPAQRNRVAFSPYAPFIKSKIIPIPFKDVRHIFKDPVDELLDTYNEYRGGIVTPKKEILLS